MTTEAAPYRLLGLCVSLFVILCLATAISALCGGALALVLIVTRGIDGMQDAFSKALTDKDKLMLFAASAFVYTALVVAVILVARWRAGDGWRNLVAWRPSGRWIRDRTSWAIACSAIVYSFVASVVLAHLYPPSESWGAVPQDTEPLALFFGLAVVFAPITEELVFRGWIYTSLRSQFGIAPALLASSALFAFLHYESSHLYALAVFPVGLGLGFIRERAGTIAASMSFHALYNFVVCTLAAFSIG